MRTKKPILVVHYSLSGNTERVADDLATRLGAEHEKIGDSRKRKGWLGYLRAALDSIREHPAELTGHDRNPDEYTLTLIGTPIWAGKITPAIRTYLRLNRGRFNDVAFFTTSGSTPAEKVIPALERLAGRKAVAYVGFTYPELAAEDKYEKKMAAFVVGLKRGDVSQIREKEPQHAHA